MSKKENQLLLFLIIMLFLTFIVKATPFYINYYEKNLNDIELLLEKKERLDKLLQKDAFWKKEYSKIKIAEEKKIKQLFSAKSRELVAAKLQTLIKNLAQRSGTKIESTHLPEFKKNEHWLIFSQNISIKGKANNIFKFLEMIEKDKKKLVITNVKLRSSRHQLSGSLTVVSFSRKTNKADIL